MAKQSAKFRDTNGRLLSVEFTTEKEIGFPIKLSASPFTTSMSDGDTIYQPIKSQGATVGLLSYSQALGDNSGYTHNIYSNLFSPKAHGTKVELKQVAEGEESDYPDNRIWQNGYTLLDHIRTNNSYCTTPYKLKTTDKVSLTLNVNGLDNMAGDWYGIFGATNKNNVANGDYSLRYLWGKSYGNLSFSFSYYNNKSISYFGLSGKTEVSFNNSSITVNSKTTTASGDSANTQESNYYACIGTINRVGNVNGWNKLDLNIYQFSVNDEIWYPCKKGDVYGLYCPQRDLTNAQESDYWIYNEKFTGEGEVAPPTEDKVLWTGYATPSTYNQDFNYYTDDLETECIDGISSLQFFKYSDLINNEKKTIKSFNEIINALLNKCDCYTKYYFPTAMQFNSAGTTTTLDRIYISECNFFGEKGKDDTDKDVAWDCLQVMQEICRYLNVTCTAHEDSVYFIDYDAVRNGNNDYYCYQITDSISTQPTPTLMTLTNSRAIASKDIAQASTQITINDVYNKVTVKDNFNAYDYELPDLFDDETAINITTSGTMPTTADLDARYYDRTSYFSGEDRCEYIDRWRSGTDSTYCIWNKYYCNPKWHFPVYTLNQSDYNNTGQLTKEGELGDDTHKQIDYSVTAYKYGAFPMMSEQINDKKAKNVSEEENNKSTINYNQAIMICWHNAQPTISYPTSKDDEGFIIEGTGNKYRKTLMFSTPTEGNDRLFGGENQYLLITGSVTVQDNQWGMFPLTGIERKSEKNWWGDRCYFLCQLMSGNYYYQTYKDVTDGEIKGRWTTEECYFKLPFMKTTEKKQIKEFLYASQPLMNNVNWRIGVNEDGYSIPLANLPLGNGDFQLKLYNPFNGGVEGRDSKGVPFYSHRADVFLLENFSTKIVTVSQEKDVDADTTYSLTIDDDNVSELGDIEFKITTYDGKKPNYSSVATKAENGLYSYIDRTYNRALGNDELLLNSDLYTDNVKTDGKLRQESWLVYRLYKQYRQPTMTLNVTANSLQPPYTLLTTPLFSGKKYIIDSYTTDYRFNETTYKLVEKA